MDRAVLIRKSEIIDDLSVEDIKASGKSLIEIVKEKVRLQGGPHQKGRGPDEMTGRRTEMTRRRDRDDAAQDDGGKGDAGMMKKIDDSICGSGGFAIGMTAYGWIFAWGQVGEAVLTEETTAGDREAAEGLAVGFRADSSDDLLHWISSFDYSTGQTASSLSKRELAKTTVVSVYDDIRFTGWSAAPYVTRLEYGGLAGLQDKGASFLL